MKWCGSIGFAETVEITPGDHREKITDRKYRGEVIRHSRGLQNTSEINGTVTVSNQISILADAYAVQHIYAMRYVTFQNAKWIVTNVDVQHPRLTLTLGGLYYG